MARFAAEGSSEPQLLLASLLVAAGAGAGWQLASLVSPLELPQAVAAFHSLVGVAAVTAAVGEYLKSAASSPLDAGATVALAAAVFIGGVTTTGSVVAFAKLAELVGPAPFVLPQKNAVNLALLGACLAATANLLAPGLTPLGPVQSLASLTVASSVLGALLTSSVGGADMPVVITVLNSYVFVSSIKKKKIAML